MKSKPPSKKSRLDGIGNSENGNGSIRKDCLTNLNDVKASMVATASEVVVGAKLVVATASTPVEDVHLTQFPIIPTQDLTSSRDFPRLSTLVPGGDVATKSDVINQEEIDGVQQELETLWNNVSKRIRCLEKTHHTLFSSYPTDKTDSCKFESYVINPDDPLEGIFTSAKLPNSLQPSILNNSPKSVCSSVNRKISASALSAVLSASALKLEKLPKKKLKGETEGKLKRLSEKPTRSGQNRSHWLHQDGGSTVSYRQAPNQFWDFAEGYCRQITYQDLDVLEKIIEDHSSIPEEIYDIPPLGPHFRDYGPNSNIRTRDRIETRSQDVCGPLTQRLVSALVDSRIASYNQNTNGTRVDTPEGLFVNRPGLMTALGLDGGRACAQPLEARLRQILVEQGLLTCDDPDGLEEADDPRDEILTDVKRTQEQLRHLHQHNKEKLKQLYIFAKREIDRAEAKRELEKADKELVEAYRVVCLSRSKKKPLSKREREVASRALDNRRSALEKLQIEPYDIDVFEDSA